VDDVMALVDAALATDADVPVAATDATSATVAPMIGATCVVVLTADTDISDQALNTFPTCDAFATATIPKIDITDPNAPCSAALKDLIHMLRMDKIAFNSIVSIPARQSYDQDVYAALNMGKHDVAVRNHGLPYASPIVTHWEDNGGEHTRYRAVTDDHWYVVAWGWGFTGIVRGLDTYNKLISGVTNARGKGCNTRAKAEYLYLKAFYAGECGVVEVATLTAAT
jgi:hypothetical protein